MRHTLNIVVLGAGAMGSIYAALLSQARHSVWIVDPWRQHTDAIEANGLRVEGASGDRVVHDIRVAHDLTAVGTVDLFVVATKASAVADAAQMLLPAMSPQSLVLTIQNGLGSGERIAQVIPEERVLLGVAEGFGASVKAPGHIQHTAMNLIRIGSLSGHDDSRIESMASLWREAGFSAEAYPDMQQLIWEKFICNVAYSAPCTVFGKTVAELLIDKHALTISQTCAIEAWQVARIKKVNLSFTDPLAYVAAFGKKVGDARPSMLLDHLAHRRSEIDAINGMVPVVASQEGLTAPFNEVLSGIVRSREQAW